MKSWLFAALVGAALFVVSGAHAGERQIQVKNGSTAVLKEIYASPPDLGDYQANLLSAATRIQAGATAKVTFEDGGACAFDFQAVTGDDDMFTARNVDVCTSSQVTFPQQ